MSGVWHRQVKKEEYDEFFKLTFKEFLEPLATAHFNVEGTIEFRALMFVPGMAPFEQQVQDEAEQAPLMTSDDLTSPGSLLPQSSAAVPCTLK